MQIDLMSLWLTSHRISMRTWRPLPHALQFGQKTARIADTSGRTADNTRLAIPGCRGSYRLGGIMID